MSVVFRGPEDYELFLYTIVERFPIVQRSTLHIVRLGATLARVAGELYFANNIRLTVRERLVFDRLPVQIESYGYEVWQGEQKLYWYDSQPHPDEIVLQSTHPHHQHVQPDPRNNRVPAPELSFAQPNLPFLILEISGVVER